MREFIKELFLLLMYQPTENELLDEIIYYSSFVLEFVAVIGVILLIICNKPLRKRIRHQDKLFLNVCVLVLCQNVLDILLVPLVYVDADWAYNTFLIALIVNEVLFLLIVLNWLVCVDYYVYRSMDHIRRRYRHALIPILVIIVLNVLYDLMLFDIIPVSVRFDLVLYGLHSCELAIEIVYVIMAIRLVKKYEKERREPRFLRLNVFIIPFVLGTLFRFYDASFMGFGVILTYLVVRRRDDYIDFGTGLFKEKYLDYIGDHWDKKGFKEGNAILLSAPGHENTLAKILSDIKIQDCFIFILDNKCFSMLTGALRKSAVLMTEQMISEAAEESEEPFTIEFKSLRRGDGQSMKEFAAQIREASKALPPDSKGGAQSL